MSPSPKKTLIDVARSFSTKTRQERQTLQGEYELAVLWAKGELTNMQVQYALRQAGLKVSGVSYRMALALREGVLNGKIDIN